MRKKSKAYSSLGASVLWGMKIKVMLIFLSCISTRSSIYSLG